MMQRQRNITPWQRVHHQLTESSEGLAVLRFLVFFVVFALFANNFLSALSISNTLTYASTNGLMGVELGISLMGAPLQVFWVVGAFIILLLIPKYIQAMYREVEPKKIDPLL